MKKKRNPIIAALLSLVFPGLGQIYNGQLLKAAVFYISSYFLSLIAAPGLFRTFPGMIIIVVLSIGYYLFMVGDAFVISRKQVDYDLKQCNKWYIYISYAFVTLIVSNVLADFIRTEIIKAKSFKIYHSAMAPTLEKGDYFIAGLKNDEHRKGDVVVHYFPGDSNKTFVKRISAISKDTVLIKDKILFINGIKQDEPYVIHEDSQTIGKTSAFGLQGTEYQRQWEQAGFANMFSVRDNFGPVVIPEGYYFMLGDNRDYSLDSRFIGPVSKELVKGTARYIYFSKQMSRIGKDIN
jgi:signal peptidase I